MGNCLTARFLSCLIIGSLGCLLIACHQKDRESATSKSQSPATASLIDSVWIAPDSNQIAQSPDGEIIQYGRLLISKTAEYFGPHGKIAHTANGMNCQNCHLDAGTKPWGNNYGGVFSTYPKYRERRGAIETIIQRVNDCFIRSLNGKALDSNSHEMKGILAYMRWLGKGIPKGKKPYGSGIAEPHLLDRAADPQKGKLVYIGKCQRCHGASGQGVFDTASVHYRYPPLWGKNSYNSGAGLFRLSRFAGYVKNNMPFGASYKNTQLTDAEAWDVAAFVNSQERPTKVFREDWPKIVQKPYDHPFGPYVDSFSEQQHKFGPFAPIKKSKELAARK